MKKKVLSFLLAIVMVVGMMPTMVLTASAETDPELSEWMKSLPDTVPISEINMPGTHDSGTAYMHKAQDTGSCQGMTIPDQLDFGIRVLDIRVDGEDGDTNYEKAMDMTVNHGGFDASVSSETFSDYLRFKHVLQYIETFLKDHPSETVVLYVSAEGGDSDDAKRILWNFVQNYHHTAEAAPCTEGEWIYNFVRCYEPGEEVPRLGEVRGKAVMLLDNGENDAKTIPAMRSFSSYEMAYEWEDDLKKDISNKVTRVEHLFTDAEENGWKIRQGIDDIGRWPIFIPESYRNMTNIGNPDIKYSGTNVTDITGAWSAISTETVGLYDGPKGLAEKFWDAAKADNILQYIIPGYRYGWITMDFPEMYPEFTEAIVRSNCIGEVHTNRVYVTGIPEVSEEDIIFDVCACYSTPSITYEYKEGTDKVIGAELVFPSQWNMERKDIDHAYAVSVSVKKDGQAFVGILKEPTVDSTTYINGVPWCEASGTIRMEEAPDTVQSSVKVVFDDGPENYDLRPKSLKEFQTMIGHTNWGGYYSETDSVDSPEKISRVPFIPEAATENSLQGNCLIGFTQDPGSDNTFTLTAQFPAHREGSEAAYDEFRLENMVGILPDCPYSCTIAADERTLVLTLENYRGIKVIGYLEYNADEDSYDRHFCRSYGIFGGGSALGDGWYLVKGNVNCPNGLTIGGNVSLILEDDCTLSVTRGLTVNAGSSLTVYAQSTGEHMGRIYADSSNKQSPEVEDITFVPYTDEYKIGEHCSGIGGSDGCDCGDITIHGGKITALGGFGSAGIGGGYQGSGGELTVYGGEITAIGGYGAAGIGGGYKFYGEYGEGGELRIVRGSITATAGAYASNAIGGGNKAPAAETVRVPNGTSLRDNVSGEVIERGFDQTPWSELLVGTSLSFTAEKTSSESPVRYRYYNEDSAAFVNGICRTYTLLNRNMRSLSDGWYVLNESGTIEDLFIRGDVHLILKDCCALKSLNSGIRLNEGSTLTVYAQSDGNNAGALIAVCNNKYGSGIGGSNGISGGTLIIHGGNISATGGENAAGIGGGSYLLKTGAVSNGCDLIVYGGTVVATGGKYGAGIGGGYRGNGESTVIYGGKVTAQGGAAGIGSGYNGNNGGTLDVYGGSVDAHGNNSDAITASKVMVSPEAGMSIQVKTENGNELNGSPFAEETDITAMLPGHKEVHIEEIEHAYTGIVYNVAIDSGIANGTVTVDKSTCAVGETVTLTATPDNGYEFGSWNVTDKNGNSITVNEQNQFIMPMGGVTVSATFVAELDTAKDAAKEDILAEQGDDTSEDVAKAAEAAIAAIDAATTVDEVNAAMEAGIAAIRNAKAGDVPPTPVTYAIIEGANSTWTKGSTSGLVVRSDAPFAKFVGVKVDGKTVAATNYTAEEGST
ncbi:MAG: hypothetical protein MJ014_02025, partial [Methanocorpusculum sp.]|nr:hypothetical protein [Methanocorpusculum sp.]